MESRTDREGRDKRTLAFLGEHRVSEEENLRRQLWLHGARSSQHMLRRRGVHCRELYKAHFPDSLGGIFFLRYSPTGDALATGFGLGTIQVRDPDSGEPKATLRSSMELNMAAMSCRFHPKKTTIFYVSCADGSILQCDSEHCEMFRFAFEKDNEVNALDLSSDGTKMMTGGKDTAIRIYDVNTSKIVHEYSRVPFDQSENIRFHTLKIFAICNHHALPNTFVSGGWDNTVKVWDLRVPEGCVGFIRGPHICGNSIDIRSNIMLTGSWTQKYSLQLWDLRTYTLLENLIPINRPSNPPGEFLYTAQFFDGDPYGNTVVAGGSGTGAVEVICINDKMMVGRFPIEKAVYTLDSYSHMLAYGGMDPYLHISSFA